MAGQRDKRPSEFGGTPGRVQGEPGAADVARLERASDPLDPADNGDAAAIRERRMEGRA